MIKAFIGTIAAILVVIYGVGYFIKAGIKAKKEEIKKKLTSE